LDILRDRERNNIAGSIFFIISTIIAFSVFDYQIALLALLMTVFGDLVSALVGIKFGKHKIFRKKTLEGFTAGFLMNMLVGWLFIPEQIVVFVLMAFVASLVELFTGKLDDNLTVPLFAGFVGQMLVYVLGIQLASFPGPMSWLFQMFV
jgi:dolichol kinase